MDHLSIAMLSIHSSPLGALGTKNTGGMSVVVRETARQLGSLGHKVDIYTAAADGCDQKVVSLDNNVRLIHLNTSSHAGDLPKSEVFDHLPQFYDALNTFTGQQGVTYDLLHSHYWLSGRLGHWAQKDWNVPHVITFHTLGWLKNAFGPYKDETRLRIEWECRLSRSCQRVLVATRKEGENLIEHCKIDGSKVGVVPFGVHPGVFDKQKSQTARERIGLDTNDSIILFVGRFDPLKGIERLMEAVSMINEPENIRLLLVGGDGPQAESTARLKQLSQRLGIGPKLTFQGRIEHAELVNYYNAADILALPSFYESFGLVALESLACGTPVVATAVGFVESVVRNGENGVIIKDQTAGAIAESLSRALCWVKEGRMPRGDVRASVLKFTWPVVTEAIFNEYLRAIDALTAQMAPAGQQRAPDC